MVFIFSSFCLNCLPGQWTTVWWLKGEARPQCVSRGACGCLSGLGHHRATVGSSPGQETAKEVSASDNLVALIPGLRAV